MRALLFVFTVTLAGCKPSPPPPLRVAAASDLALAFTEVGAAFEKSTGSKVEFSFGSTGLLAKQIGEGAPFDLFAAANQSYADEVVKRGACLGESRALYARGQIVMWSKAAPPKDLADLADPRFAKIAIANPEHAPYGQAAQQAMQRAGVWDAVRPRVVYGENVQQALAFATSGNADVAIVALSLATSSSAGQFTRIDPKNHDAIDQALVVCKNGKKAETAPRFAAFVASPEGRTIMRRHGFLLPGETEASR